MIIEKGTLRFTNNILTASQKLHSTVLTGLPKPRLQIYFVSFKWMSVNTESHNKTHLA